MSFRVFTDSCSNLPGTLLRALKIEVLPCSYTMEGVLTHYDGDIESFNSHAYYDQLRAGKKVTTSLLNTEVFLSYFRPVLAEGEDIIYIGLSGGISGTIQAARIAAEDLREEFPDRTVSVVDSLGAGLGAGLLACLAADLRAASKTLAETAEYLNRQKMNLCEYFTVDDLNFLRHTGRVSAASAMIGTMLNIKPILRGDESGHIVVCQKVRSRNKAMDYIAQQYAKKVRNASVSRVAISHGDCPEDAKALANKLQAIAPPKELILCPHEPFTGAHVGPGMLAAFFFGEGR